MVPPAQDDAYLDLVGDVASGDHLQNILTVVSPAQDDAYLDLVGDTAPGDVGSGYTPDPDAVPRSVVSAMIAISVLMATTVLLLTAYFKRSQIATACYRKLHDVSIAIRV